MTTNQEGAARRNRALRKIRACKSLPIETRAVLQAIIDHLSRASNYAIAWPSAGTIGRAIGRSARTVRWHLRGIRQAQIFSVLYLTPEDAIAWCKEAYGFQLKLDRVQRQAPPIYVVNEEHWLWSSTTRVTPDQDRELARTIAAVIGLRNRHRKLKRRMTGLLSCPANFETVSTKVESVRRYLSQTQVDPATLNPLEEFPDPWLVDDDPSEELPDFEGMIPIVNSNL